MEGEDIREVDGVQGQTPAERIRSDLEQGPWLDYFLEQFLHVYACSREDKCPIHNDGMCRFRHYNINPDDIPEVMP